MYAAAIRDLECAHAAAAQALRQASAHGPRDDLAEMERHQAEREAALALLKGTEGEHGRGA